jgi:hypothetical protein
MRGMVESPAHLGTSSETRGAEPPYFSCLSRSDQVDSHLGFELSMLFGLKKIPPAFGSIRSISLWSGQARLSRSLVCSACCQRPNQYQNCNVMGTQSVPLSFRARVGRITTIRSNYAGSSCLLAAWPHHETRANAGMQKRSSGTARPPSNGWTHCSS